MYRVAFAFLAGTLSLQLLPDLPGPTGVLGALLLSLAFIRWRLRVATCFVLGFFWAWLQATLTLQQQLPEGWEGTSLLVQGRVAALPERQPRGWQIRFDINRVSDGTEWRDFLAKVRLNWYSRDAAPEVGESWQLEVRLKRPHGFANPGGFDYEGWLFRQGIRATGYVRKSIENGRLKPAEGYFVQRLRARLNGYLNQLLPASDGRALIQALVIGKRDGLTSSQWDVLRRTGTSHLMAISGLHIGLTAGLVFVLVRRWWALMPGFAERLAAPRIAALASMLAALIYALIAGFSVPTQRALIMVTTVCGAQMLGHRSSLAQNLTLALFAVLVYDPSSVLSPSFMLSFAAVGFIAYGASGVMTLSPVPWWRLRRVIRLQWLLALGLLPLTLVIFQQAAWLAPIANLLAVPWMSLGVVPVALLGTLLAPLSTMLGGTLLTTAHWLLEDLWWLLESMAALPGSLWEHARPPMWTWAPAIAGILWTLLPKGIPARWLGCLLLLPAVLAEPARPALGSAWLTLLDVGQGLAAVIQTRNHVLVFDTGPRWSTGFNTGEAVVVPYLISQGWKQIDRLIISHGDNDHIGGAQSLMKRLPVASVITSVPEQITWARSQPCVAGQAWGWDGVRFSILYPAASTSARGNDRSCVLKVQTTGGTGVLLPGDIERGAERYLVETSGSDLKADVLVAPHHGSRTSSTPEFVAAVAPKLVLFPVGYRNRFGFPVPEVSRRYARRGIRLLDTADSGAIEARLPRHAGPVEITTHRRMMRRYWHRQTVSP